MERYQGVEGISRDHPAEMVFSNVHPAYGGTADKGGGFVLWKAGLCDGFLDRGYAQKGGAGNYLLRRDSEKSLEACVRESGFAAGKVGMGRHEMAQPSYPAPSLQDGTDSRFLPHPDGRDDSGTCYDDPACHLYFILLADTYSAMVLTDLKISFPSAGLLSLMP